MGLYRVRDMLLPPTLVSLMRLPLALAFVLAVDQPVAAFLVLVLAGISDVLDGFLARHYGQATATGAAIDPVTDKVFVLTVVITLVIEQRLGATDVLLLATREIGELPLVAWFALSRSARRERAKYPQANAVGKAATVLQFGAVTAALFRFEGLPVLLWITAAGGLFAAVSYWRRALREA